MQVYSTDFQDYFPVILTSRTRESISSFFFSENKALLGKTNHVRFLFLSIPIYVQNMKVAVKDVRARH